MEWVKVVYGRGERWCLTSSNLHIIIIYFSRSIASCKQINVTFPTQPLNILISLIILIGSMVCQQFVNLILLNTDLLTNYLNSYLINGHLVAQINGSVNLLCIMHALRVHFNDNGQWKENFNLAVLRGPDNSIFFSVQTMVIFLIKMERVSNKLEAK